MKYAFFAMAFNNMRYPIFTALVTLLSLALINRSMAGLCEGKHWIVVAGSLQHAQPVFPLAKQQRYFNSPCTFLILGNRPGKDYLGWNAIFTRSAKQLAAVKAAAENPTIKAILYDPESWNMTPKSEQLDPIAATCKAAMIAHAHGKFFIAAPAIDLMSIIAPDTRNRYVAFAQLNIAREISKCVDAYDIQAQSLEYNVKEYRDFVRVEVKQVRSSSPHVLILAGISTNNSSRRKITAWQLYKAVNTLYEDVDGFWLNIPSGGKYCPQCYGWT